MVHEEYTQDRASIFSRKVSRVYLEFYEWYIYWLLAPKKYNNKPVLNFKYSQLKLLMWQWIILRKENIAQCVPYSLCAYVSFYLFPNDRKLERFYMVLVHESARSISKAIGLCQKYNWKCSTSFASVYPKEVKNKLYLYRTMSALKYESSNVLPLSGRICRKTYNDKIGE